MRKQSKLSIDIQSLWHQGFTKTEIADTLVCSRKTVYNHTVHLGRCATKLKRTARKENNKWNNGKNRVASKEYVSSYLDTHHCVDCGNSDKRVLEFDHVRGVKSFIISLGAQAGTNIDKIKEEIEKCEVRCANCHRIVTCERRKVSKLNNSKQ